MHSQTIMHTIDDKKTKTKENVAYNESVEWSMLRSKFRGAEACVRHGRPEIQTYQASSQHQQAQAQAPLDGWGWDEMMVVVAVLPRCVFGFVF